MSNEMIERVAKAMFDEFCPAIRYSDADKIWYQQAAKIAIAAMREPTDQQRNNYYREKWKQFQNQKDCVFYDGEWERMIDAALKED